MGWVKDCHRRAADRIGQRTPAENETNEGFTLIELMVVLLILGILLAIAIPTFLGTTKGAEDRQAQSDLSNALIAAKAIYTQTGNYPSAAAMVTALTKQEPELSYVSGTTGTTTLSTKATKISIYTNATLTTSSKGQELIIASYSANSGVCWLVKDIDTKTATLTVGAGDHYNFVTVTASSKCRASTWIAASGAGTATWQSAYEHPTTGK